MNTDQDNALDILEGQLTIFDCFDCLKTNDEDDLETMTMEYIADQISKKTGFRFNRSKTYGKDWTEDDWYTCQFLSGKVKADIHTGRFSCDGLNHKSGQRFISAGVSMLCYSHTGCSSPCYTIDEAAEFIKHNVKRLVGAVVEHEKPKGNKSKAKSEEEDGE